LARAADLRVDRDALQKFLNDSVPPGYARLDNISAYARTAPGQLSTGTLDMTITNRLDGFISRQLTQVYGANRVALDIWGNLSAGQRPTPVEQQQQPQTPEQAQRPQQNQGVTMPIQGLGTSSRQRLFWETFNSETGPNVNRPRQGGNRQTEIRQTLTFSGGMGGGFSFGFGNMADERTEVLPNGLPGNEQMRIQGTKQQVVKATDQNKTGSAVNTASSLGSQKAMNEYMQQMSQGRFGRGGNYDRFQIGTKFTYTFTFQLSPFVTLSRSLEDFDMANNPLVGFNDLPQDVQAQFNQGYAEGQRRTQNMNVRFGNGGNTQSP
jgi:hypothetical protein